MPYPQQMPPYPSSPLGAIAGHPKLKVALCAILGVVIGSLLMIFALDIRFFKVPAPSMEPTIKQGERIVTMRYLGTPISMGDVVAYRHGGNTYVKRVVACGGDRVAIADGRLMVNGQEGILQGAGMGEKDGAWTLGEDEYFLLGDNLENSQDSRYIGPVQERDIVGKLIFVWHTE